MPVKIRVFIEKLGPKRLLAMQILFTFLAFSLLTFFSIDYISPDISYRFVASRRKRAWLQGVRSFGNENILDNMSRSQNKRNAVDMPDCDDAVVSV